MLLWCNEVFDQKYVLMNSELSEFRLDAQYHNPSLSVLHILTRVRVRVRG